MFKKTIQITNSKVDLETILTQLGDNTLRTIKSYSLEHKLMRYNVISKLGVIYVVLKKNETEIDILIYKGLTGYFIPAFLFLGSLLFVLDGNNKAAIVLVAGAFVFLLFTVAHLYYHSRKIVSFLKVLLV